MLDKYNLKKIIQEVKRSEKNFLLIDKLMQMTFALRHLEIVKEDPIIGEFLQKWPALRIDWQVKCVLFLFIWVDFSEVFNNSFPFAIL